MENVSPKGTIIIVSLILVVISHVLFSIIFLYYGINGAILLSYNLHTLRGRTIWYFFQAYQFIEDISIYVVISVV